ncbi:MAG: hypothetical protein IH623_07845 [Verrucomicrobia bacterium]|nr:hypothetical protein [Verrucomicrobiota bacterium]
MDNPSLILETVDAHLDHAVRLVIYGRAAIWLGFNGSPPEAARTQDVDAVISTVQESELEADHKFWDAIEAANSEMAARGLYITHLFSEREVFLRRNWVEHIVPVTRPQLRHLQLFRPATIDLVLSKMMRGRDPQDMTDAEFMIRHDRITETQLLKAFAQMKPIELVELRDAFAKARPVILQFARQNASG